MPAMSVQGTAEPKLSQLAVFTSPPVGTWSTSDAANGNKVLHDVPVFRAGTFRDSLGMQRTWDVEHLFQMVQNFNSLRAKGILPNVPLRVDHSFSAEKVMGWITGLRVDGDFLSATFEVTEPADFDRIQRGTYRSRSLEVGMYETNDEQFYWPTVLGVAFVDLPAVEGLHRGAQPVACFSAVTKEQTMSDTPPSPPPPPTPDPAPPTPADAGARRDVPATATFRVNGADTVDVGAVQRHIDSLEKFATESRDANRRAYVAGLASTKKITQPQVEGLTALALTMTDEQFDGFRKSYDTAPQLSLLGDHANGVHNPNGDESPDPRTDRIAVLNDTVTMLRRSGLSEDQIAKSPSHKELVALSAQPKV